MKRIGKLRLYFGDNIFGWWKLFGISWDNTHMLALSIHRKLNHKTKEPKRTISTKKKNLKNFGKIIR